MVQKRVLLTLSVALLTVMGHFCQATPPSWLNPFNTTIEPVTPLAKEVPVAFKVSFSLDNKYYGHPYLRDTGTVSARLFPFRDRADTLYYETWPVQFDDTYSNSVNFTLTIPDNNVFGLEILVTCGGLVGRGGSFFIPVGDDIEFTDVLIDPPMPREEDGGTDNANGNRSEIDRDTLTKEQLQMRLDMAVDLSNQEHMRLAREILGRIPDTCIVVGRKGHYIINMTLDQAYKLYDLGVGLEGARGKNLKKQKGSQKPVEIDRNESSTEGREKAVSRQTFWGLSLDSISVLTPNYNLPTDTLITFYIHIKNTCNVPKFGIQTGFRIYSPNGASWGDAVGDTLPLGWGDMFDLSGLFINHYSANGYGADTIAFGGAALYNGMPGDFDERSFMITIGPIDGSMDGKTICLDSSFFPPAGNWMWCDETGFATTPPWDGPRCFEIEKENTITYSGHLSYLDPVPPDTNQMPMRKIRIELWDDDYPWGQD